MKLAKLSLAAIMVVGALSTANAAPLEEAIKGVDFSGMLRYRLNDEDDQGSVEAKDVSQNDFDFLGKFTAPVTSDLKAVLAFASSSAAGANNTGNSIGEMKVDLRKAFFVYKKDALTVKAGLQALGTPVTDNGFNGNKGTGVIGMYNLGSVTLAGAYFGGANAKDYNLPAEGVEAEIAAVAALGSFGAVNAQVWGITVQSVVERMIFAQVDGKVAGVSLLGQVIHTKLADAQVGVGDEDTGTFYAVKAGYAMDNFSFNAGYVENDEDQPYYSIAGGDSSGVVYPGWRLGYEIDNEADTSAFFADAGATFGKVGVKAGYAASSSDTAANELNEIWGQVSYKYAKNFNTYVKYSDMESDGDAVDQKYFRFEAKYSF